MKLEYVAFLTAVALGIVFFSSIFGSNEVEADGLAVLSRIAGTTGMIVVFRIVVFAVLAYSLASIMYLLRTGTWPTEVSNKSIRLRNRADDAIEKAKKEITRLLAENEKLTNLLRASADIIRDEDRQERSVGGSHTSS